MRLYRTMDKGDHIAERETKVLLVSILYIALCSVTEVAMTYYAIDLFSMFLLINIFVMARNAPVYSLVRHTAQLAKRDNSTYVSGNVA